MVKTVRYEHQNTYEVLNPIHENTAHIWICFHGLGYLASFFKRYFIGLNPHKHAVIVLQAPAKHYLGTDFKHVGACWLTRVDTAQEMDNNARYIDEVLNQENIYGDPRLVLLGYSQGVSIATRFFAQYHFPIQALIMHSGSLPEEFDGLTANHFNRYGKRFIHIIGLKDEYLNDQNVVNEKNKIKMLFGTACEQYSPDVKHEVAVTLLEDIAKTL